jgi:hypothetical protein
MTDGRCPDEAGHLRALSSRSKTGSALAAGAVLAVILVALSAAPQAPAARHATRCRKGAVRVKVGKRAACVPTKAVLPPPGEAVPLVAGVQGALTFANLGFKAPSGRHVPSFRQKLGPSWTVAQKRLEKAMTTIVASASASARASASATASSAAPASRPPAAFLAVASAASGPDACTLAEVIGDRGIDAGQNPIKTNDSTTVDGAKVTLGLDGSGAHLGIDTTVAGNTYSMRYDSNEFDCLAYKLPPCPHGDGSLGAFGVKGKEGFSLKVTRAGKVLKSETYKKTITVETKGQVAEDAKLDYVDVKYGETTSVVLDGTRLTQYGNRAVRIDMRSGDYGPDESSSFGSVAAGGDIANVAGVEADAKGFASFVSQTVAAYRDRENAWQTPNRCARLKLSPTKDTLTLGPGQTGSFNAEGDAVADGSRAAKASWTLSGPQNGAFSPAASKDPGPTFSYEVSGSPSGDKLLVTVKATSSAGVAEETWSQNISAINTISGTFSGHEAETDGIAYEWSGEATFTRFDTEAGGAVFGLTSGQATVSVSSDGADGCTHAGTEVIPLAPQGLFTLLGTGKPVQYQIVAPWDNRYHGGGVTVTCGETSFDETDIPAAAAIQSGEVGLAANPTGLIKTSSDGVFFADSASESDAVLGSAGWTWSLKGAP